MDFKVNILSLAACCLLLSGCSINKFAINKLGDALSASGTTFASDDDPELVKSAIPFSLKLIESLLAETPNHRGLLLAASSGFTQYSYAFVQQDADEMEEKDLAVATAMRVRARGLYLRARNYGLRGLELKHPGLSKALHQNARQALASMRVEEVPFLYWTAASWAAAISVSKDNPELVGDMPVVEAMMERALALDEKFGDGSIHSFFITYEMSRPGSSVDAASASSRKHFDRVLDLAKGQQAGPYVSLAEAVSIQKQDKAEFTSLLQKALAVDVNQKPEWRLVNLVMQKRARWLLSRVDDLILDSVPKDGSEKAPEKSK